jgi:cell division protein FtsZ
MIWLDVLNISSITVFGLGGAGCKTIHSLYSMQTGDYSLIAADADWALLNLIDPVEKIFLDLGEGKRRGHGAGGFYHYGKMMAESRSAEITAALSGCEFCILTYGLGGGTGSGGGPVVARLAKEHGATVLSLVSYPFRIERKRLRNVGLGLEELIKWSDTVVINDFQCLTKYSTAPLPDHFETMGRMNAGCIDMLCACLSQEKALVPLMHEDVIDILKRGGFGYTYVASVDKICTPEEIAAECMRHPYLHLSEDLVNDVLILIGGGEGLSREKLDDIASRIGAQFGEGTGITYGACVDNRSDAAIKVIVIAMTGERSPDLFQDYPHYGLKPPGNLLV